MTGLAPASNSIVCSNPRWGSRPGGMSIKTLLWSLKKIWRSSSLGGVYCPFIGFAETKQCVAQAMSSRRNIASIQCAKTSFKPSFAIPRRTTFFSSTTKVKSIRLKLWVYSSSVSIHCMPRITSISSRSTMKKSSVTMWFAIVILSWGTRCVQGRRVPTATLT